MLSSLGVDSGTPAAPMLRGSCPETLARSPRMACKESSLAGPTSRERFFRVGAPPKNVEQTRSPRTALQSRKRVCESSGGQRRDHQALAFQVRTHGLAAHHLRDLVRHQIAARDRDKLRLQPEAEDA